ncbi:hypothetical protein ACFLZN_00085 [Nanoarchaeota archaeon]
MEVIQVARSFAVFVIVLFLLSVIPVIADDEDDTDWTELGEHGGKFLWRKGTEMRSTDTNTKPSGSNPGTIISSDNIHQKDSSTSGSSGSSGTKKSKSTATDDPSTYTTSTHYKLDAAGNVISDFEVTTNEDGKVVKITSAPLDLFEGEYYAGPGGLGTSTFSIDSTTEVDVPPNVNVDLKDFDPTNPDKIPTSGGGYITNIEKIDDDTYNYDVYDDSGDTDRMTERHEGDIHMEISYLSDDEDSEDYGTADEARVTVDGINDDVDVDIKLGTEGSERGQLYLDIPEEFGGGPGGDPSLANAFLRAAVKYDFENIGMNDFDEQGGLQHISGEATDIDLDMYATRTGIGVINANWPSDDKLEHFNKDGSVKFIEGRFIDAGVLNKDGTINDEKIRGDYLEVTRGADGKDEYIYHGTLEKTGRSRTSTTECIGDTCTYDITTEDGSHYEGSYTLGAVKADSAGEFDLSADRLNANAAKEFGSDVTMTVHKFKDKDGKEVKLYNIEGGWYKLDPEDGTFEWCTTEAECYGISSEELAAVEDETLDTTALANNLPSTEALQIGQFLDSFSHYATHYTGMAGWSSLMFDEEFLDDWKEQVNDVMCETLYMGGIDCWSSEICKVYVDTEEEQDDTLVGRTPDGLPTSIATIQGERSPPFNFEGADREELLDIFQGRPIEVQGKVYNLTDPDLDVSTLPPITARVYKITYSFKAQEASTLNVQLRGARTVDMFNPVGKVSEGGLSAKIRSNPLSFISSTEYAKVCLVFQPAQETWGGRTVTEYCTVFSEYDGAGTPVVKMPITDYEQQTFATPII